jgi:hypothetical protein
VPSLSREEFSVEPSAVSSLSIGTTHQGSLNNQRIGSRHLHLGPQQRQVPFQERSTSERPLPGKAILLYFLSTTATTMTTTNDDDDDNSDE